MNLTELQKDIDTNILKLNVALEEAVLELGKEWTDNDNQRDNESSNEYYARVMPKNDCFFNLMGNIGSQLFDSLQKIKIINAYGHGVDETISQLEKDIKFHEDSINKGEKLLSNTSFLSKAKEDVVKKEKEKLQQNIKDKIFKEEQLKNILKVSL